MPFATPKICRCGLKVPANVLCSCQARRKREQRVAYDANRGSAAARGYDSKWQREREAYLKMHSVCRRCNCEPASVVDHVIPHRGDQKLFWSRSNWQPLCATCHNRHKQRAEKAARAS